MKRLPPGRVMLDIGGTALDGNDRRRLQHPCCAGVILFTRNYENPDQLSALCDEIKALRDPPLLIAVDQEGGRVQRFREYFTTIPPMEEIGSLWNTDAEQGTRASFDAAVVIGTELGACGIDFSFAPVLDIDHGRSTVIGNRAFHASPDAVIDLARAFISGLNLCSMVAVGKHFPGHGGVETDSHHDIAVDYREYDEIERVDLRPFAELCRKDLGGVMPAHVIYARLDALTAGFSKFWLQDVLRKRIGFRGVIFSDDLSMEGASIAGRAPARAKAAVAAGCDLVLVCNAPDDADAVLDTIGTAPAGAEVTRILALHRKLPRETIPSSDAKERYARARDNIARLEINVSKPAA
jgi:beta-N-acetylhexosaminidase